MINLKLLNKGQYGVLTPQEFFLLYVISNAVQKNNKPTLLYDDMLAAKVGLSKRQIERHKESLIEKGFIRKFTKQISPKKRACYYSLNLDKLNEKDDFFDDKIVQESDEFEDKFVQENAKVVTPVSYYKNNQINQNKKNNQTNQNNQNEKNVEEEEEEDDELPF